MEYDSLSSNASTFDYCSGFSSLSQLQQPRCLTCLQQLSDDFYLSNCTSHLIPYRIPLHCQSLTLSTSSLYGISGRMSTTTEPRIYALPSRNPLLHYSHEHHNACSYNDRIGFYSISKWSHSRCHRRRCNWRFDSIANDYWLLRYLVRETSAPQGSTASSGTLEL